MSEDRSYVLVDKFGGTGGAPDVVGPFTFDEADSLLKQGAAICGTYRSSAGYWSDLPIWHVSDDYCWLMRKLDRDFSGSLNDARRRIEE